VTTQQTTHQQPTRPPAWVRRVVSTAAFWAPELAAAYVAIAIAVCLLPWQVAAIVTAVSAMAVTVRIGVWRYQWRPRKPAPRAATTRNDADAAAAEEVAA
jgi:hypothetical protein